MWQQRVTDVQRAERHRAGANTRQTKPNELDGGTAEHVERVWREKSAHATLDGGTAGRLLLLLLQTGEPRSKEEKQKREKTEQDAKSECTNDETKSNTNHAVNDGGGDDDDNENDDSNNSCRPMGAFCSNDKQRAATGERTPTKSERTTTSHARTTMDCEL